MTRRPGEGWDPAPASRLYRWIPAFAGTTRRLREDARRLFRVFFAGSQSAVEVAVRMNTRFRLAALVAAGVLSLSACTQPSAPSQASTKPAPVLDHDPVGAIRAAGMSMGKD